MQKSLRYITFASLYFTQGTVLGYFASLNTIYLRSRGVSEGDVGIFAAILLIPFVLKILLGLLSDRVNLFGLGHRRPYIVLGLVIQTLCLVIVPFVDPAENFTLFIIVGFTLQLGMAWYDTCTDGLALDTTPVEEEGTIQAFMVGGRAAGVIVASGIAGLVAQNASWQAMFWTLAALTLLPFFFLMNIKEPQRTGEHQFQWKAFAAFKDRTILYIAALGFLVFFIIVGTEPFVTSFLEETFAISVSMAGFYGMAWGIGVVLGGISGGALMARLGKGNSVKLGLAMTFGSILLLAFIPNPGLAWVLVPFFGLAYGIQQTVYFALAMEYTDTRIAASMFSILMAVTNIGQGVGLATSGFLAETAGYRWMFIIMAALNILAVPLLPLIFKPTADKVPEIAAAE